MTGLTPRQLATLDMIAECVRVNGCAPTYAELAELLGIGKISAYERVQALAAKGAVTITPHRHRGITLPTHCPTCGRPYMTFSTQET